MYPSVKVKEVVAYIPVSQNFKKGVAYIPISQSKKRCGLYTYTSISVKGALHIHLSVLIKET